MVLNGINPHHFITTRNSMQRDIWLEVHRLVIERRPVYDQNLAVAIATEIAKLFEK